MPPPSRTKAQMQLLKLWAESASRTLIFVDDLSLSFSLCCCRLQRWTPLFVACNGVEKKMIKFLCRNGADPWETMEPPGEVSAAKLPHILVTNQPFYDLYNLIQSTMRITTLGWASEKCPCSRSVLIPEISLTYVSQLDGNLLWAWKFCRHSRIVVIYFLFMDSPKAEAYVEGVSVHGLLGIHVCLKISIRSRH